MSFTKYFHLRSRALPLLAAVCTLSVAAAAHAQFRASLTGTVTDTTGAVIPNATVTLTDTDTGKVLTMQANGDGVYSFNALPPDHFRLGVATGGFQAKTITNLTIVPEQPNNVNVQLEAGSASTTVDVNADTIPPLETATASISGTVTDNQIQHLPSASRDVFQLVQLAPGVFGDGSQSPSGTNNLPGSQGPGGSGHAGGIFSTENGPQANANGGQYETNGISIDGISTVSAVWGGTSVITPTEDSIGNVKVLSNGYDAENGRFSGAQIQVTSKTGTNQLHGSLFLRANRPGLNAYQRYNGPASFQSGTPEDRGLLRDTTLSNQYGGSVGGPILHDKLFAFFAYETQRNHTDSTSTGWYETSQFRAAAPTGSIANTYLNFPGSAPTGNLVAQTCDAAGLVQGTNCQAVNGGLDIGSPLKSAKGSQDLTWQSGTNPGVGAGLDGVPDVAFYTTSNPTTSVGDQYNGRLDADVTKRDHVAFAIYWVPQSTTNFNGPVRAYNLYHHEQINDAYSVIWNHTFSPTFLNEARANDAGWRWNEITTNPQEPFGLAQSQVDDIGSISGDNALKFFGAPGPSNFNQHTYTYKDVATKVAGNHTIKFGGEVTRLYYLNNPTYSARPSYNFYNVWDFLNDAPRAESGSFDPNTGIPTTNRQDTREDLYGFFVQDDWKLKPNITVNMGLRYNYFGPYSSKQNNLGVVQFGQGSAMYTGLNMRRGGNLTNAQKGNFGPQFGFAYSPEFLHGKGVLRGGYGLNFNQTEIAITGNSGSNPPYVLNANYNQSSIKAGVAAIDPRIVYTTGTTPTSLFGYPANPNATGGFNAAGLPTGGGVQVTAYQQTQPTIYTHHYSLDLQFELPFQFVATAGYQGSNSRHLIVQSQAYVATFPLGYARNPLVNNVDYYGNTGNSNNNQLLVGLRHNMSHHFQADAEFQYAKTMDTGSGPYYEDPYPYAPYLAYGRSDFNFGKALKVNALWQPVFFHGANRWMEKIAGGWSLSGIYNIHTGFPYTPVYNVGNDVYYAGSGYGSLRPAAVLSYGGQHTGNSAFEQINGRPNVNFPNIVNNASTPYFNLPDSGLRAGGNYVLPTTPGVARNSFTGPGYQDLDATLTKAFGLPKMRVIGEGANIEIRADAFNVFNNTNLNPASVQTNVLLTNFGQANSGLAGRVINLQARFSF